MRSRIRKVELLKHPNGKSPYWYLRWWELKPDGKAWREVWKSSKTTVKREAEEQRRRVEQELDQGRRPDADMPWEDFKAEFLDKHVSRKGSHSVIAYRQCLKLFTDAVKPTRLGDVTLAILEDYCNARLDAMIAPATVNKELRHVRAAIRWACKREYVGRVPDFGSVFVRVEQKQPEIIPEADFLAMVAAIPKAELKHRPAAWWRVFLYVGYYLGMRRGEILGLTWDQVRFNTSELLVSATTSKGKKDRVVPMAPELAEVLKQWRDSQNTIALGGEMLPWPRETYRQLYDDWHAIQTATGIEDGRHYVPKNCRSSCASELIASGAPTAVVKDFLGHASVTTTERYYINTRPALRAAVLARKVKLA